MFGIPENIFIPFASILGTVFLAVVVALGQRWGKRQPAPGETTMEVAGALVDSKSVNRLTAAIEAATLESITVRHDNEKARKVAYDMVDAANKICGELGELRRAMGDVAKEIARMK